MQFKLGQTKLLDKDKKPLVFYHATPCLKKIKSFFPLSHFGTKSASDMRAMHFVYKALKIKEPLKLDVDIPPWMKKREIPKINRYSVNLCIKSPLKIFDLANHSLMQYYNWFYHFYKPKSRFLTGEERCEGDVVGPAKIGYKKCLSEFIFIDPFTRSEQQIKDELLSETLYDISSDEKNMTYIPSFLESVLKKVNRANFSLAEKLVYQRMIRFLEGEGYDGFVYQNECEDEGSNSYIIFRPQQVFDLDEKETIHTIKTPDANFLKQVERDFFSKKGIISPAQRIEKYLHTKYILRQKKQH